MTIDNYNDFAFSYIAIPPYPVISGTAFTLMTGTASLFPTPPFNVVVWPPNVPPLSQNAEIVRVISGTGDGFYVERAQEGTSPQPIAAGWQIAQNITAGLLNQIVSGTEAGSIVSLSGPGLTTSPGLLTQTGGFYINDDAEGDGVEISSTSYLSVAVLSGINITDNSNTGIYLAENGSSSLTLNTELGPLQLTTTSGTIELIADTGSTGITTNNSSYIYGTRIFDQSPQGIILTTYSGSMLLVVASGEELTLTGYAYGSIGIGGINGDYGDTVALLGQEVTVESIGLFGMTTNSGVIISDNSFTGIDLQESGTGGIYLYNGPCSGSDGLYLEDESDAGMTLYSASGFLIQNISSSQYNPYGTYIWDTSASGIGLAAISGITIINSGIGSIYSSSWSSDGVTTQNIEDGGYQVIASGDGRFSLYNVGVSGMSIVDDTSSYMGGFVLGEQGEYSFLNIFNYGNYGLSINDYGNHGLGLFATHSITISGASTEFNSPELGFFSQTPTTQPTITGMLSAVIDPNAQAVMGSIISALAALGLAYDGTS